MPKEEIIKFIEKKQLELKIKCAEGSEPCGLLGSFDALLDIAIDELKKESVKK
ncbi:MAG: hypothetical protein HFH08_06285 [Bacilli bacterium]|nr:hypothetical protein [Bacilli bacterium]